jgi:hypothetical protein
MARTTKQQAADAHESGVCAAFNSLGYLGAHVTAGSGNQPGKPGDVKIPGEWLVECKTTAGGSIAVSWAWLNKVRKEASQGGLRALVSIRFFNSPSSIFYVIEDDDLYHLLKCEHELRRLHSGAE